MFYLLQRSGGGQPPQPPPQPQPPPGLRRHLPCLELRVEAGPAPRPRQRPSHAPRPRPLGLQPGLQIQYQLTVRSSDYQMGQTLTVQCPALYLQSAPSAPTPRKVLLGNTLLSLKARTTVPVKNCQGPQP